MAAPQFETHGDGMRNIGLLVLRGYLVVAAILVAVRFGQTRLGPVGCLGLL
jgi:hypothetical protein